VKIKLGDMNDNFELTLSFVFGVGEFSTGFPFSVTLMIWLHKDKNSTCVMSLTLFLKIMEILYSLSRTYHGILSSLRVF